MQMMEQIIHRRYEAITENADVLERKQTVISKFYTYYAYFIFYSFVGWVWETTITSVGTDSIQKRGFLDVPILPIYGFAITFIVLAFYHKGYSIPKIFIGSAAITSAMEFITSWTLEKIFHQVWWDYSQMRFQIQGRVCLIGAIIFGVASVIIVQLVHPMVERVTKRFFDNNRSRKLCVASMILILSDTIVTSIYLLIR